MRRRTQRGWVLASLVFSACTWIPLEPSLDPSAHKPNQTDTVTDSEPTTEDSDDGCSAEEIPYDGIDNDCDTETPDDDLDGDGYLSDTDCDDNDASSHPIDWYPDVDNDSYGAPAAPVSACPGAAPNGYVTDATDCDDTSDAVHPGAPEICDGFDNDCNTIDDDGFGADCACALLDSAACSASSSCLLTHARDFAAGPVPASCSLTYQDLPTIQEELGPPLLEFTVTFDGAWMEVTLATHDIVWNGTAWDVTGTASVAFNDISDPAALDITGFFSESCDVIFNPATLSFSGSVTTNITAPGDLDVVVEPIQWMWGVEPVLSYLGCDSSLFADTFEPFSSDMLEEAVNEWAGAFEADIGDELSAAWPFTDAPACVPDTCNSALSWATDPASGDCLAFDTQCAPFGWSACTPPDLVGAVGFCPS